MVGDQNVNGEEEVNDGPVIYGEFHLLAIPPLLLFFARFLFYFFY
jgi:hypothetical protein